MKRRLISILTITCLLFCLAGCQDENVADPTPTEPTAKTYQVGVVQLVENNAFTDMREGFVNRMRELGYDESQMTFIYKNAQGDPSNLNAICQELVTAKVDFIVSIVTPATQAIVNMDSGIPVFFISVTDPVSAGVMSDMANPDKNATGTSNAVPVDEIFNLANILTPEIQTYGLLYNTGEVNAVKTIENAKAYLDSQNIAYVEQIVTNSSEVQQAAQALVGQADAIYVPIDSMVQSAMPQVAEVAKEAKLPVYGSSAVMVQSGALATVSVSDIEIGKMTAEQAHQFLTGTPLSDIPAVTLDTFTMVINQTTAAAIDVIISDTLQDAVLID